MRRKSRGKPVGSTIRVNVDTSPFLGDIDLLIKEMELKIKERYKKVFGRDGEGAWDWTVTVDTSRVKPSLLRVKALVDEGLKAFILKVVEQAKRTMIYYIDQPGTADVTYKDETVEVTLPRLSRAYSAKKATLGLSRNFVQFSGETRKILATAPVTVVDIGGGISIQWAFSSDKFRFFNEGVAGHQVPRPAMQIFQANVENRLNRSLSRIGEGSFSTLEELAQKIGELK